MSDSSDDDDSGGGHSPEWVDDPKDDHPADDQADVRLTDDSDHTDAGEPDDEEEWRFGVDDVDENGVIDTSIEPESISLENAAFVVLGVVLSLLILARAITVFFV